MKDIGMKTNVDLWDGDKHLGTVEVNVDDLAGKSIVEQDGRLFVIHSVTRGGVNFNLVRDEVLKLPMPGDGPVGDGPIG